MATNAITHPRGVLEYMVGGIRQSPVGYLTVTGIFITALLILKGSSPDVDSSEPPLLKPGIPIIGHWIGLLKHKSIYLKILYDKSRRQIATLPIFGAKVYVIFDPIIIQSAYRKRTLTYEPFILENAQSALAISDKSVEVMRSTDLVSEFFGSIPPAMNGAHLYRMNVNALKHVSQELGAIGDAKTPLRVPNLYLWLRDLMTMVTSEALFGPSNPLKGKPSLVEDLWDYEGGIAMLLTSMFPSITARKPYSARARLQSALEEYYIAGKDSHEDAAQVVRNRANVLRKFGIPNREVGRFEISLLNVATENTIPVLFWLISHIFARPDLVERLRDEVLQVTQCGDRDNDEVTVDITALGQKCPLLVSCYREVTRLYIQAMGARKILEDTTVTDASGRSYLLKKGLNLQTSAAVLHTMDSVWGENVHEFFPERFIETGAKENSEAERLKRAAFVPFGGGRHLCPGRNFAFAENLGLMACLLLGYDVLTLDGKAGFQVPAAATCSFVEAACKPVHGGEGFGVQIQRKKGWEMTKWQFVSAAA